MSRDKDLPEKLEFEEELSVWVNQNPFESFTIIATSGDHFEVNEKTQVVLGANTVWLFQSSVAVTVLRKNQLAALHKMLIQ